MFPVWRTAGKAYALVFGNLRTFLSLAAIPMALSFLPWIPQVAGLDVTFVPFGPPAGSSMPMGINSWIIVVYLVASLIVLIPWVVFLVSWHRFVLLGHRDTRIPVQFRLGKRELRFFLYSLLLVITGIILWFLFGAPILLILGPLFVPSTLTSIFGMFINLFLMNLLIAIPVFLVLAPLLLLFPAVSVDSDTGLKTAWKQGQGVRWRLLGVVSIALLPFFLLAILFTLSHLMWALGGGVASPQMDLHSQPAELIEAVTGMTTIAQHIVNFLASAVAATVLSLVFPYRAQWPPSSSETGANLLDT